MRFYITFLFFIFVSSCVAQKFTLNISSGVGTYAMKDLKAFQKEIQKQFPFKPTITDEFPPYFFYELSSFVRPGKTLFFGFGVSYGSTGGRVQYRDYSGYLRADQQAQYLNVSIPAGVCVDVNEKLVIQFDLRPTYTMTTAELRFEQKIVDTYEGEHLKFNAEAIALQPGLLLMRNFKRLGIHAQASYYATFYNGKMYLKENQELFLINDNDKPIHTNWDGVRVSLGLSLWLR